MQAPKPHRAGTEGPRGIRARISLLPPSSIGLPLAKSNTKPAEEEPGFGAPSLKSTDSKERQMQMKDSQPRFRGTIGTHRRLLETLLVLPEGSVAVTGGGISPPFSRANSEGWGQARFPLTDTQWDREQDLETGGCFKLRLHFANPPVLCTEVSVGREHTFAE